MLLHGLECVYAYISVIAAQTTLKPDNTGVNQRMEQLALHKLYFDTHSGAHTDDSDGSYI
jgi:hypothetical protein